MNVTTQVYHVFEGSATMDTIPIGERVNGIRIIKRTYTDLYYKSAINKSLFDCECLCGAIIQREAAHIIIGGIYPCEECRKKYNIKIVNQH